MRTFTVLNHGTAFNRAGGEKGEIELIGIFGRHLKGQEVRVEDGTMYPGSYLINEGPGSPSKVDPAKSELPSNIYNPAGWATKGVATPSHKNPFTGKEKPSKWFGNRRRGKTTKQDFEGETAKYTELWGKVTGGGWTDNVIKTVFTLITLNNPPFNLGITRVNMLGWSRGAVTCIRIANLMKEVFEDTIQVNIFAVDPVAGRDAGTEKEDTYIIPSNVGYFFSIVARDERRNTFAPQDLSRIDIKSTKTRSVCLPMPGTHAQQVKHHAGIKETAEVTWNLAWAFLKHFGTEFQGSPISRIHTVPLMCDKYGAMRFDIDTKVYEKQQTPSSLANRAVHGVGERSFLKNMDDYVAGGAQGYFINEHHRTCFKRAFPHLYGFLFCAGAPMNLQSSELYNRLRITPNLLSSLMKRDLIRVEMTSRGREALINRSTKTKFDNAAAEHWPVNIPLLV